MRFAFTTDDIRFPVYVGLDADEVADRQRQGAPVPPPVIANAVLDTGTNITAMSIALATRIGLRFVQRHATQTAAGSLATDLYSARVSLPPLFGLTAEVVLADRLTVATLPGLDPGIDVLFGLDLLLACRLEVDGPARTFALHV